MQGNSSEKEFHSFVLKTISTHGGWRMAMPISEVTKEMQKLDPKHTVNLFRKQFGNISGCLKTIKNPVFYLDSSTIKLQPYDKVKECYQAGAVDSESWEVFDKAWKETDDQRKQFS